MSCRATEKAEEENSAIFALRDVNAVVEQEEKYKLEARQIVTAVSFFWSLGATHREIFCPTAA